MDIVYGRLLFWNLRHRRWRHGLNALTMAVSVAVVITFVSVLIELVAFTRMSTKREMARILVWPNVMQPGGDTGLPLAYRKIFEGIEGVKVVQTNKLFSGRHESGARYIVSGEEHSGVELNTDFFPVEKDVIEAWKKEKLGAIVTEATAKELGLEVGEEAEVPTTLGPMQIKVVGLSYGGPIGHRIAVHFDYAQELSKNSGTAGFRVFTAHKDYERVAREIVERTKNSPVPAQPQNDAQATASWVRRVGMVPALLGFLGIFLVFTTALTMANNAAIAIRERRTELATMRVVGYKQKEVLGLILSEFVLVGLIGGVFAIAVTAFVFRNGVQLTPGAARLLQDVTISPVAMLAGLALSILVPLAGTLPAAIASIRQPLVKALRDSA